MPHCTLPPPLNNNYQMMSQDETMKVEFSRLYCDVCEARPEATSRCQECETFLCIVCKSAHLSFKVLRHHTIVDLREGLTGSNDGAVDEAVQSASLHGECEKHPNVGLQFFCEMCHMVICRDCIVVDHPQPDHKTVDLKDTLGHKRESLQMLIQSSKQIEFQINEALNQLSEFDQRIETATQTAQAKVNRAADHALVVSQKQLEEKRQRHLQDVITVAMQRRQTVFNRRDQLQNTLASFRQTQNLAASIVENGSDREVLSTYQALADSLHEQMTSYHTSCGLEIGSHLDNFAFLSDKHDPTKSLHRAFATVTLGHVTGAWILHREIGGDLSNAGSLAVSRWREVIVVENERHAAKLYDQTGEHRLSLATVDNIMKGTRVGVDKILGFIRAVAFSKAGHIILCDCSNFVKVFSRQGKYLCAFKTTAAGDSCSNPVLHCCLAVDDKNRIYVGDRNRRCVTIHEPNGARKQLIECTRPSQLAVAGQYLVVLPADPTDSIKLLYHTGTTQRTLVVPDTLKPWQPVSVACSWESKSIFVVNGHKDGDRAIHEFSMEGDYRGCVTMNLVQPAGIALSSSQDGEELLVADDKSVKVLQKI